jgi:hypothetical protein
MTYFVFISQCERNTPARDNKVNDIDIGVEEDLRLCPCVIQVNLERRYIQ